MLDVDGHRARRRSELTERGRAAAEEVQRTGAAVKLTPMTAVRAQGRPRRRGRRRPDQRVGGRGAQPVRRRPARLTAVSRGTRGCSVRSRRLRPSSLPPVPGELFGPRWPLAEAYVARLAGDGVTRGLIGPRERDRLWDRHVLNCAAVAPLIPADAAVGDVGSGAGLPGIVIALLRTDVTIDLIEPLLRRTTFLDETVEALGLSQTRGRPGPGRGARRPTVVRRGDRPSGGAAAQAVECRAAPASTGRSAARSEGRDRARRSWRQARRRWCRSGAEQAEVIAVHAGAQPTWVIRVVAGEQSRTGRR